MDGRVPVKKKQGYTHPVQCMAKTRRVEALRLRKQGLDYATIAEKLGIAQSTAYGLVKEALDQLAVEETETADEVRQIELARLDRYQSFLDERAEAGDEKAILAGVKIMERRARLLNLDKDPKTPTQMVNFFAMSSEELVAEARRQGLPIPPQLVEQVGREGSIILDGEPGPQEPTGDVGPTGTPGPGDE